MGGRPSQGEGKGGLEVDVGETAPPDVLEQAPGLVHRVGVDPRHLRDGVPQGPRRVLLQEDPAVLGEAPHAVGVPQP